jgi:hypothetical protein
MVASRPAGSQRKLQGAFKSFDYSPGAAAKQARLNKDQFCRNWPITKETLENLRSAANIPDFIRYCITMVIRAGDLVYETVC